MEDLAMRSWQKIAVPASAALVSFAATVSFAGAAAEKTAKVELPIGIPKNMVAFFHQQMCPSGWVEVQEMRGRYVVGLPTGGQLALPVGSPLGNGERRNVLARHSHAATPHHHVSAVGYGGNGGQLAMTPSPGGAVLNPGTARKVEATSDDVAVAIGETGQPDAVNAPYLQLLACRKS
jgi:hypothetical protein